MQSETFIFNSPVVRPTNVKLLYRHQNRFAIALSSFFKFFHPVQTRLHIEQLDGYLDINLKALLLPRHFQIFTHLADTPGNDGFVNKIIVCINPEFQLQLIKAGTHADDMWVFVVDTLNVYAHKL